MVKDSNLFEISGEITENLKFSSIATTLTKFGDTATGTTHAFALLEGKLNTAVLTIETWTLD